nr:hypothetical protein Iba_chr01dCG4200 [Ipomoea batatas]
MVTLKSSLVGRPDVGIFVDQRSSQLKSVLPAFICDHSAVLSLIQSQRSDYSQCCVLVLEACCILELLCFIRSLDRLHCVSTGRVLSHLYPYARSTLATRYCLLSFVLGCLDCTVVEESVRQFCVCLSDVSRPITTLGTNRPDFCSGTANGAIGVPLLSKRCQLGLGSSARGYFDYLLIALVFEQVASGEGIKSGISVF